MKKITIILIIIVMPFIVMAQTYRDNTINNRFTGYNLFTKYIKLNSVVLDDATITNAKNTYTTVVNNKSNWDGVYNLVNANKSNWSNAYTMIYAGKSNWDSAYAQSTRLMIQLNNTITLSDAIDDLQYLPIPMLTTTQINALTPTRVIIVYDKTLNTLKLYNGSSWKTLIAN
jgi:hypothetical protein